MTVRIAILDLYEGQPNQGMRCIREIIEQWGRANRCHVEYDEFDVRLKCDLPNLSYDVYISSGGPGSPVESEGLEWDNKFCHWMHQVERWNSDMANFPKKHIFFICHSFQLACRYYKLGNVCKRNSTAFGVFPVHKTRDGADEIVFEGLKEPFFGVDSRDYQLIQPNHNRIHAMGAKILAIEKERPHVRHYERAVMAMRFNDYFVGTQFHPEADATGMSMYLQREDKKKTVIANHGEKKWRDMLEHLQDPDKIMYTYNCILPNFLNIAAGELVEA